MRMAGRQAGFTFPELLVVSALILLFIGIMLLLVRPANYDPVHRNAQRRLDLAAIMTAISIYKKETGTLPPTITAEEAPIATQEDGLSLCAGLAPKYLPDIPLDPIKGSKLEQEAGACSPDFQLFDSGYTIKSDAGRVILAAPHAELGETINMERWFPLL